MVRIIEWSINIDTINSKTPVEFWICLIEMIDPIVRYYVKFDGSVRHGSIKYTIHISKWLIYALPRWRKKNWKSFIIHASVPAFC